MEYANGGEVSYFFPNLCVCVLVHDPRGQQFSFIQTILGAAVTYIVLTLASFRPMELGVRVQSTLTSVKAAVTLNLIFFPRPWA